MRHKGEVCPKSEILEHVWDFAFDGDPNIVEVYVAHLRKKLDLPFGRRAIQTMRLVGLPARPRWRLAGCGARLASVRARATTAASCLVVGCFLIVVGLWLHRRSLRRTLEGAGRRGGRGPVPRTSPSWSRRATCRRSWPTPGPEDTFIQVVDGAGGVMAASANVRRGQPPVAPLRPAGHRSRCDPRAPPRAQRPDLRLAALPARRGGRAVHRLRRSHAGQRGPRHVRWPRCSLAAGLPLLVAWWV